MNIKTLNLFLLILILVITLQSCATINYVGKTYPATENIQTYYSFDDVPFQYTVFGHIVSDFNSNAILFSADDFIENLEKEAMHRGADALIITELDTQYRGENEREKTKASLVKYLE